MILEFIGVEFTIEPALKEWMTQRLEKIASRFGPIESVGITIRRHAGFTADRWTVSAACRTDDRFLAPRVDDAPDLEVAFDDMMIALASQLRSIRWARDGVAARCRWCDGDEYLHVHRARQDGRPIHLASDPRTTNPVGLLEALLCRGCGHVEWFASDPGRISAKQDHVTVVRARPPSTDPFR